ncbi:hypothetical protein [Caproiciproducens faecalis]|uniref:YcxB-like protein n=1 Tax=Caproiciproducens faecalis TaxID=2820301 RepID=A0ABS7DNP2_9FIRM|nr:hypothetical protein [Caproiciproducens faecalis]MBW7572920.1 hypothetical protein [Caproiciproducens faecalis]
MKHFVKEQDTASKPPEPRGEQTPDEDQREKDRVEWDGSEAELVADETALAFEEQQTGIKLKYTLTSGEIFKVLWKSQYTAARMTLSVIAVVLSAVMTAVFLTQFRATGDSRYLSLAVVCLLLILTVAVFPTAVIRVHSSKIADGREIRMKVYPDHIEMGLPDKKWEIALDGTSECVQVENLMVLYIDDRNMVILPLRCVEPAVLPEIQAMILAGTHPKS